MKPERWQQIDQILKAALDREENQRAGFLDQECGEDEALRKKVEALLAAHRRGEDFLEEPALEMAAKGIARDQLKDLVGRQLNSYEILSFIAAGGMGEVYRARDTQLEREVAIKVLPAEFTQDPERLARFQREAKLLAALNHPNIATIHGLEESDGIRFLVLELVEGQTLAERLVKGPLSVEKALAICHQIAEGIEAAHEKGVIHRDLKPANIKITPQGKVKILDFGLAKAFEGETAVTDLSQSPTLTEEMTRTGVILGTAAYLSPEQARGKLSDKRTDIWAFGCVLFELLTGKKTFEGETITETVASVLKSEPKWERLPGDTPWDVRTLLRRCLQKDPVDRLHDIADARIEIKEALREPTAGPAMGAPRPARTGRWALGLAALTAIVTGVVVWSLMPSVTPSQPLNRFVIPTSPNAPLGNTIGPDLAISPDGSRIVYLAEVGGIHQLYVRSFDEFAATPISGTEGTRWEPIFSPDGESVVFYLLGQLKRISIRGGSPRTLARLGPGWGGGNWFEDTILFSTGGGAGMGLHRVSAAGGEPEILAFPEKGKGVHYFQPEMLPGGRTVLFSINRGPGDVSAAVLSLETGEISTLLEGAAQARYAPTGHLVYTQVTTGILMAVSFDLAELQVTGRPVPVLEEGTRFSFPLSRGDYALSRSGVLSYVPGQGGDNSKLVWVGREGKETLISDEEQEYSRPRLSPDGKQILLSRNHTTVIYDLEQDSLSPLLVEAKLEGKPNLAGRSSLVRSAIWTRDGKKITFLNWLEGKIQQLPTDRSSPPQQLTEFDLEADFHDSLPSSWSPNGQLAFHLGRGNDWDIYVLDRAGGEEPQPLIASPGHECCAVFSPDGHWLAYVALEQGRNQVFVRPFPQLDVTFLVSEEESGGGEPVWSPDGKELFYRSGKRMLVVPIQTEPAFHQGRPEVLFEGSYRSHTTLPGLQQYDISPDGQRFLMLKKDETPAQIHVVLNWFEELKRLVPAE